MKTTEELVREALLEEEARKERKHQHAREEEERRGGHAQDGEHEQGHHGKGKEKRVEFEGDDASLDVRIKEAKRRRTAARRGGSLVQTQEDVELGDVEEAEEAGAVRRDLGGEGGGGVSFTAFNLDDERATGRFDKDGNYYWNDENDRDGEKKDKDEVEDAWLKDVDVLDKSKAEAALRAKRVAEDQKGAPEELTERQIALLNMKIADILKEGETVQVALQRLGGKDAKRAKRLGGKRGLPPGLQASESGGGEASGGNQSEEMKADFKELTECSTTLMGAGELDVFSKKKVDFERAASLFLGTNDDGGMDGDDGDDDMFAEDEGANAARAEGPSSSGAASDPAANDDEDYGSWSISKLKQFLVSRGEDLTGVAEKAELVTRARNKAKGESCSGQHQQPNPVPPGYVWDPHSSYYFNHDKQLYFDSSSGYFFNGTAWVKEEGGGGT
ncbi:OCRE domain-containing protein [Chloropicon primus]|uniref:Uncharacterized protein n=2 Tax=Chloropicon primus TaxID=1764295 RepID=A0A5B8MPM7_9CHLO|nr:hypothetical protein A3770_07p49770 [Chloropicon primus]UPR01678.1 OCRE domain-containing protein [Chloropicon primus]|eukprot:QDZ22459.1 hypothetical protein A3770_07p49770 [Chloropicon primus]